MAPFVRMRGPRRPVVVVGGPRGFGRRRRPMWGVLPILIILGLIVFFLFKSGRLG
jgi:hypothetical protein